MFKNAIVKKPAKSIVNGITTVDLGVPDYKLAIQQHKKYIEALRKCNLTVLTLNADEDFPDSCFVEDTAVVTRSCAIITRPGAKTRRKETQDIAVAVKQLNPWLRRIKKPGTVEGGDIMQAGYVFYIGISERTNKEGADQLAALLHSFGYKSIIVEFSKGLHLKTGVSYIENNNLLATGEFVDHPAFSSFNIIEVGSKEAYAANSIWINGKVIMPAGYPKTKTKIENAGYETIEVDTSEFQKVDGGLSCLSLRF